MVWGKSSHNNNNCAISFRIRQNQQVEYSGLVSFAKKKKTTKNIFLDKYFIISSTTETTNIYNTALLYCDNIFFKITYNKLGIVRSAHGIMYNCIKYLKESMVKYILFIPIASEQIS